MINHQDFEYRTRSRGRRLQLLSEHGSMTLESAIVVPIVLLTTFMMFYLTVVIYERAAVQTAANGAAISASICWSNGGVDPAGILSTPDGTEAYKAYPDELYWRIFDGKRTTKEGNASTEAMNLFQRGGLNGFTDALAFTQFHGGIFTKSVHIGVESDVFLREERVPAGFGVHSHFKTALGTQSVIPDIPEFQRNVDFVVDIEQQLEERYPELKEAMDKYRSLIDRIHGYIGGLV